MDQETRTALKASIKAWEHKLYLVERKEYSRIKLGPEACPLCDLFFDSPNCEGCPVQAHTNISGCNRSPYVKVSALWTEIRKRARYRSSLPSLEWRERDNVLHEALEKAVQKEISFLKDIERSDDKREIARALKVSTDYLLGLKDEET